jgi:putative hemolysin
MLHPRSDAPPATSTAASRRARREVTYCDPDDPFARRLLIGAIERLTGQPRLQRIYDDYMQSRNTEDNFWQSAVEYLRLSIRYDVDTLAAVPKSGPLIMIANHPFGVLDGIAAGYLTTRVRSDMKLLAPAALGRATALRPYLIPIEFDGASSALRSNVTAKRAALDHLRDGGSLVIFPAGRVSTARNVLGTAVDDPWKLFAGKLIEMSGATVVPVFFAGQNGMMFHLVSKFSEAMREALLLREVARRMGDEIVACIGAPLSSESLQGFDSRQALLDYLRDEVYAMGRVMLSGPGRARSLGG